MRKERYLQKDHVTFRRQEVDVEKIHRLEDLKVLQKALETLPEDQEMIHLYKDEEKTIIYLQKDPEVLLEDVEEMMMVP